MMVLHVQVLLFFMQLPESFSQEHVRLVRMIVKHILYFMNGHVQSLSTPSVSVFSSTLTAVTETFRRYMYDPVTAVLYEVFIVFLVSFVVQCLEE